MANNETTAPAGCKVCSVTLGRNNRSGYCRRHVSAINATRPDWKEKIRAGMNRRLAEDPDFREAVKRRASALGRDPATRKARSENFKKGQYWKLGSAAQDKEVRARAGRSLTEYRLSWCPPHLRDEYRWLYTTKKVPAVEARKMIEEQHEAEMTRWRRSIGIEIEGDKVEVIDLATIVDPVERVVAAAAAQFGVSVADLLSPTRASAVMPARYAAALVLKRARLSMPKVAKALHRNDHTSAIHWVKQAEYRFERDPQFVNAVVAVQIAWNMRPAFKRKAA